MALGIQQGACDQRCASGADGEALGEERHGQAPVLQRGFFDHGFGGRGQERRFAKGHWHHGHGDQHQAITPKRGAGQKKTTNGKAAQTNPESETEAALGDPITYGPLQ